MRIHLVNFAAMSLQLGAMTLVYGMATDDGQVDMVLDLAVDASLPVVVTNFVPDAVTGCNSGQRTDRAIKTSRNNSLRYNWGMRMLERNPRIANNALYEQGDALFDLYDTVVNRLDWLSEFDRTDRKRYWLAHNGRRLGEPLCHEMPPGGGGA
jgi:hypothetical protein